MKRIFTLLAFMAFTLSNYAQSPDLMTYQAVLRDAAGHLLTNQAVAVQISILQGAPNGTAVYTEVHALNTNDNGLISLLIGDGVTSDDFSIIDWLTGPYFLKTETDPAGGTDYTITSTTQLVSVPYAKFADKAGNVFSGDYGDLLGAPTNVSAFTNDAGYRTGELWSDNGGKIFYNSGFVGIGIDNPHHMLNINSGALPNYLTMYNDGTGTTGTDGFMVGNQTDLDGFVWNWEVAPIYFGTSNVFRMTISSAGDVGIGTQTPDARLNVVGDTRFGSNGLAFTELRELTGTTDVTNAFTTIALPAGYDENTARVLSIEINYNGDRWSGLGMENSAGNENTTYLINGSTLYIYYPDLTIFKNRAVRVLIMQIAF
jgi:hypothetical protein